MLSFEIMVILDWTSPLNSTFSSGSTTTTCIAHLYPNRINFDVIVGVALNK